MPYVLKNILTQSNAYTGILLKMNRWCPDGDAAGSPGGRPCGVWRGCSARAPVLDVPAPDPAAGWPPGDSALASIFDVSKLCEPAESVECHIMQHNRTMLCAVS